MKTKTIFKFLALFLTLGIMSCGSDDDTAGEDGASVTSVSVVANTATSNEVTTLFEGESATFVVTDNLGNDVTDGSTITINGVVVTDNPYLFTTAGTYEVVVTNGTFTSTITIVVSVIPVPTAITLTSDIASCWVSEEATFQIEDDLGNYVTGISAITVGGVAITGNTHVFTTAGTFDVVATFSGLTSNTVTVTVVAASAYSDTDSFTAAGAPANFTKKVLLEDFTGTWCGQCPGAGAAMVNAVNETTIFGAGYHASGGDPMEIPETAYWSNYYNVTGFPTVYANGPDTRWNFPGMTQVNNELAETATVGLAVNANIVGGKLDLEVKVGYNAAMTEEIKLMIYLVEDDVTVSTPQAGSSQGANYVHHDVLREVYTAQLGDVIAVGNIGNGGVYTRTMTGLDLPSSIDDVSKLKVVAFVRNTYTKTFVDYFNTTHTNSPHYDIYNVQGTHVGSNKDFD
ncbi:MAG: hypothetical protein COA88_03565 [Kordia sp.]|nr:MAG: hypothetical protein COA88_03565 [Kordia sp.]